MTFFNVYSGAIISGPRLQKQEQSTNYTDSSGLVLTSPKLDGHLYMGIQNIYMS